jgi:site-specific recombinase XerD
MVKSKKEIQIYKDNEIDVKKEAAWNSLSEESRKAYGFDFKLFFNFINKPPDQVTANDILEYIEFLKEQNYKNATINRKISSLSKLFKVMVVAGEIKQNPVDVLKQFKNVSFKTNKEVKISLTLEDIKEAVNDVSEYDEEIVIIIKTLVKTGLRVSEMINIRNDNIEKYDDKNYNIRIVGKRNKERFIFLENKFLDLIKKIYPDSMESEFLFYNRVGNRLDRRVIWGKIRAFFFRRIGKKVTPHTLRHFYATYKINKEKHDIKAVSRYLGHSDVSTTLNSYVDTALDIKDSKIKI